MDVNLIRRLVKLVEKSEITEFSIQEGDLKVRISKNSKHSPTQTFIQPQQAVQQPPHQQTESSVPAQSTEVEDSSTSKNLYEIKSPIVGTFYRAPAPDADPYVQIGDAVSDGTVLCIVEAMKLMNEIESDVSGKVVKILVDNATPVEYNQPLFLIEKD